MSHDFKFKYKTNVCLNADEPNEFCVDVVVLAHYWPPTKGSYDCPPDDGAMNILSVQCKERPDLESDLHDILECDGEFEAELFEHAQWMIEDAQEYRAEMRREERNIP